MKYLYCLLIFLLAAIHSKTQAIYISSETNIGVASNAIVNKPTATAQSDLLVVGLSYEKGSAENITAPGGWTLLIRQDNTTNVGIAIYYKVAGPSEPASYSFALTHGSKWSIGISRFTNANSSTPVDVAAGSTGFGTAVTAPTLNTTGTNREIMAFYTNKKASTYTPAAGTTERYDAPDFSDGLPSLMMATFSQTAAGATGDKTATATDVEFWSGVQIAVSPSPGVLPVKFTTFDVVKSNGDCLLSWATAEEQNAAYFEVERSENGNTWTTIARIAAAGNSTTVRNYSYTDQNITLQTIYYRIRQVDRTGTWVYTSVKFLKNNNADAVHVANSDSRVMIRFNRQVRGTVEICLVSLNGQIVLRQLVTDPSGSMVLATGPLKGGHFITIRGAINTAKKVIL